MMASMVDRLGLNPYWLSYKTIIIFRQERVESVMHNSLEQFRNIR